MAFTAIKIVAGAEVLWAVCCAMSSRKRKPHGKIVGWSPAGMHRPKCLLRNAAHQGAVP